MIPEHPQESDPGKKPPPVARVIKGAILENTKDFEKMERKIWIKYTFGGSESFSRIFTFKRARIEVAQKNFHFIETISHGNDETKRIISTAYGKNPTATLAEIKTPGKKKELETKYFNEEIPHEIIFHPDFNHRIERSS